MRLVIFQKTAIPGSLIKEEIIAKDMQIQNGAHQLVVMEMAGSKPGAVLNPTQMIIRLRLYVLNVVVEEVYFEKNLIFLVDFKTNTYYLHFILMIFV